MIKDENTIRLYDLYTRIVETTGLDIVTMGSLRTAIANCFADLTSRGYKTFREITLDDIKNDASFDFKQKDNWIKFKIPKNVSKTIYFRVYFPEGAVVAERYSLSNKRIACRYINGEFRSLVDLGKAVFYTKGDSIYLEWHTSCGFDVDNIALGYYEKLAMPDEFPTNLKDDELLNCKLNIRKEFEDAIVFYAAYFYYARYIKDSDKINAYLNQYKYYVEDITHELSYEDEFNEEDAIIKIEEE